MLVLKGQKVVEENKPGHELYVIMTGELQVTVGQGTDYSRDLGYLSTGAFFGESPVLSTLSGLDLASSTADTMRSRTVTAVTECELCYLTRQSIMKLSLEYPELRARLRRCVAVVAGFSDTRPV